MHSEERGQGRPQAVVTHMKEFIGYEEARQIVVSSARRTDSERVLLHEALGRILAEPVISTTAIPPFDNSSMDGYAVRREDVTGLPAVLRVVGELSAGSWPSEPVRPGECVRIMTGAPTPAGIDSVVPVEWTEEVDERHVRITRTPGEGHAIRRTGMDVEAGERVFSPGVLLTPPAVGMLAAIGQRDVAVARRPRLSIIATGTEIVDHDTVPSPGQIRNSNGPALSAQTIASGGEVRDALTVGDDASLLRESVERGLESDVLVLSGGVSVGAYDLVKDVLSGLGVDLLFWKVRQRPGKPLLFGLYGEILVFGLPGNPVSASICFDRYVRPVIHAMLGRVTPDREQLDAVLTEPMQKVDGLRYFARGVYTRTESGLTVRPSGSQSSGVYSALVEANCIIHLPEEMTDPPAGTTVQIEPLRW